MRLALPFLFVPVLLLGLWKLEERAERSPASMSATERRAVAPLAAPDPDGEPAPEPVALGPITFDEAQGGFSARYGERLAPLTLDPSV